MSDLDAYRDLIVERRARLHLTPMAAHAESGLAAAQQEVAGLERPEVVEVRGGFVCVADGRHGDLSVVDVVLDDPAAAPAARDAVRSVARARGAVQVGLNRYPGDPATTAFADHPAFAPSSSNLVLDLAAGGPFDAVAGASSSRATLEPMDRHDFVHFAEATAREHAEQQVASGAAGTFAEHLAGSRASTFAMLPDGPRTPRHHVFHVVADGERVGRVWLHERSPAAGYVYDVEVGSGHRGRGLGRAAMDAGAAWCREQGLSVLGLNVFDQNHVARALYDALGYRVVADYLVAPA